MFCTHQMIDTLVKYCLIFLLGLSACKTTNQKATKKFDNERTAIKGIVHFFNIQGKINDIITRQPIKNLKFKYSCDTTYRITADKNGKFQFNFTFDDTFMRNSTLFNQKRYFINLQYTPDHFMPFWDRIEFNPQDTFINLNKTIFLIPYNIDSLVLGWTIGNLIDTLKSKNGFIGNNYSSMNTPTIKNGYVCIQRNFNSDELILQVYFKMDTTKWTQMEIESLILGKNELYKQKITGTGLRIKGLPVRYINVDEKFREPFYFMPSVE